MIYKYTGYLNQKSDVYSLGVVLLETLSGRQTIDDRFVDKQMSLVAWAIPMLADKGELKKIIDPRLEKIFLTKVFLNMLNWH